MALQQHEYAAQELTQIVNCKIVGCDEEALSARGRYAKLCDLHRQAAAAAAAPAPPRADADPEHPVVSIKKAAQKLVPAAADLDRALQRRNLAREDTRQAFAMFKDALDELHRVAREAVQ